MVSVVLPAAVGADADQVRVAAARDGAASHQAIRRALSRVAEEVAGVGGVARAARVLALVAVVVGVVDVAAGEGARILDLESAEVLDVVPAEVDVGARAGVPPRGAEGLRRARVRDVEAAGVAVARPVQPLL